MGRPIVSTRRCPVLVVAALAPLLGGCDPSSLGDNERARVAEVAAPAADSLKRTLSGHLLSAMANGGPAAAIEFCSARAGELTDSVTASLATGWEVRRTTLRTRNPRNAPDSLEAEALRVFHAAEDAGQRVDWWVQRTPAGAYRYYEPLRIGHMCLQCHGRADEIEPSVRQVLDRRYPLDQATGYAEHELRGVLRVTVPASAVER